MSLGYAEKLSFIEDVGNVGMTEYFDPPLLLQDKVRFFSLFWHFFLQPFTPFVLIVVIFNLFEHFM